MSLISRLFLLFLVSSLLISCKSQNPASLSDEAVPSSVSNEDTSSSSGTLPTSSSFIAPVNKTKLERPQRVVVVAVAPAPVPASLTGVVE